MLSIEAAIQQLDQLISNYEDELVKICETVALDARALITNRIQQQGLGGQFYSENPLPTFFYEGRELNGGGRSILKRKDKKKEGLSYKEWREANGLQAEHVDLSFTNRMWQNLVIIGTFKDGENYTTVIGGGDEETKKKLEWNTKRYGSFLKLNADEETILKALLDKELSNLLNKYLK